MALWDENDPPFIARPVPVQENIQRHRNVSKMSHNDANLLHWAVGMT
jgi:hypothetical protein